MKNIHYLYISCLIIALTIFIFAYQKKWVILNLPYRSTSYVTKNTIQQKTITLYAWQNNQLIKEKTNVTHYADSVADTIKSITHAWLTFLYDERIIPKKIAIQSVLITPSSKQAYISFSQNLLPEQKITAEKIHLIQSFLKTLHKSSLGIQEIYFLVNHRPLQDPNLDFANPWPIQGFLTS